MKLKAQFLTLTLSFLTFHQVHAQSNATNELDDFKIIIENTDDGISMKSLNGCAWRELSFGLKKYNAQAVDEFGMTELGQEYKYQDAKLADFLFTITKTNEGVELKGFKGTAWKELSFTLSKGSEQAFNQLGMTNE